jgi:hypothetical protein
MDRGERTKNILSISKYYIILTHENINSTAMVFLNTNSKTPYLHPPPSEDGQRGEDKKHTIN